MWKLPQVNNKDIKTTSMTSLKLTLKTIVNFKTIVDFEQVNNRLVRCL